MRPQLHRRLEPSDAVARRQRRQPLVHPRVMRHVAAGTKHDAATSAPWARGRGDGRRPRRRTRSLRRATPTMPVRRRRNAPVSIKVVAQLAEPIQVRDHARQALRRTVLTDRPLVAGDAGEPQADPRTTTRVATCTASGIVRHPVRPPSNPSSTSTGERPVGARRAQRRVQDVDRSIRVDVAQELERRIGELLGDPRDRDAIDHLVGDQHAADARRPHHARLSHRRRRDPPCARARAAAPTAAAPSWSCRAARCPRPRHGSSPPSPRGCGRARSRGAPSRVSGDRRASSLGPVHRRAAPARRPPGNPWCPGRCGCPRCRSG